MAKSQKQTDQIITDFEKNFGLRLQKLTDQPLSNILHKDNEDDPQADAEAFETLMKNQLHGLKRNFRNVVDGIRTNEVQSFIKANKDKAQ